jgi:DNA-binding transcriptional LysR family regulator
VLPAIVAAFRERFPDVELEFDLGHAERLQQEVVAAGELELAFVASPLRVSSLASRRLWGDPFVLLGPEGDAAAPDLSRRPLLAYNPCTAQRELEDRLEREGVIASSRVQRLEDGLTIRALVGAGCAYALLPRLAVDPSERVLRTFDAPVREIHIVWHHDRLLSPAAEGFVEAAAEAFAAHRAGAAAA